MVASLAIAGCSSSFEQSKKLEAEGSNALAGQKGVTVGKDNPDIKVTDTATVTDENGSAVVVSMRNTGKTTQVNLPIAIDVLGKDRKSVFKNNTPGLEPSLAHVALIEPGKTFDWVNDQVQPAGTPAKVRATIGPAPKPAPPGALPEITFSGVHLTNDATSGILATGTIHNGSKLLQTQLVAYGVVRDGGKVVAAGRAELQKLKPGKDGTFRMFFIGDPRKGKLQVTVPPSTLGEAK
jgi:hypothetical protein